MPFPAPLESRRRSSRAWLAIALVVGGALFLPLQVSAAGAAPTPPDPSVSSSAGETPEIPGPGDLTRKPPVDDAPECPPYVLCGDDDPTIDPCPGPACPTPEPPECGDFCPPPPVLCELNDEGIPTCPEPPVICDLDDPADPGCPPVTHPEPKPQPGPQPKPTPKPKPGSVDKPVPAKPTFTG